MTATPLLFHLDCGLPVLLLEQHDVAVATADVWVRTGSADEPAELSGVSHFLEHMLFKGTAKYGLGEIERRIERCGGQSNAGTSYDFTHYYVTLPADHIGVAIDMLAEMVRNSVIDPTELEKERLVILEEYRRKQDHPSGVLYERLYAETFRQGRYHDPVIGYEETIKSISRKGMLDYYHRRYSAQNMLLVVTGDVEPDQIRAAANAAFENFERPLETLRLAPPLELGAGRQVHEEKATGGELYVAFAWPAPGFERGTREEILALDVAQFILGQGRAARLYQNIKEKRGLCSSIGAFYPTHAGESMFAVSATCLPAQLAPLRAALLEELEVWQREPIAADQLGRAQRLLASAQHFGMETSSGSAGQLGYYYTLTGKPDFLNSYLDGIHATSAQKVQTAIANVLPADRLVETLVEVAVGPAA
jgi:zinc protease